MTWNIYVDITMVGHDTVNEDNAVWCNIHNSEIV